MNKTLIALAAAGIFAAPLAEARITRIEITKVEPAFGGQSFEPVGAYERLLGRAHGEVNPGDLKNAIIQDITLAPRNARGMVEYSMDVLILKPIDVSHWARA